MTPRPPWPRRVLVLPIAFYRRYLSRLKPPMCRFHPTCSAYAHEAILTHGVLRGAGLALWRILRCQPFAKGGLDPVPPRSGPAHGGTPGESPGESPGEAAGAGRDEPT